ncbi:MAG: substrate-binding periplasmic protein [Pseudomonadales bacterium]
MRFLLLTMLLVSHCYASDTITLTTFSHSVNRDISQSILTEAYSRLGLKLKVDTYPGERALLYANLGRADGALFRIAGLDKQYRNLKRIAVPINTIEGTAFYLNEDIQVRGWASLTSLKVGIMAGAKYSQQLAQGKHLTHENTVAQLWQLLYSGSVDVIIVARARGLAELHKLALKAPPPRARVLQRYPLYHYLHRRHSALVTPLTRILTQLQREGFIAETRERLLSMD